jgi:hypothetical protein
MSSSRQSLTLTHPSTRPRPCTSSPCPVTNERTVINHCTLPSPLPPRRATTPPPKRTNNPVLSAPGHDRSDRHTFFRSCMMHCIGQHWHWHRGWHWRAAPRTHPTERAEKRRTRPSERKKNGALGLVRARTADVHVSDRAREASVASWRADHGTQLWVPSGQVRSCRLCVEMVVRRVSTCSLD